MDADDSSTPPSEHPKTPQPNEVKQPEEKRDGDDEAYDDEDDYDDPYLGIVESILSQFRCSPDKLDVEKIDLDLHNFPALKTFLSMMVAMKEDGDSLVNFLTYVISELVNLDDFEVKYQLVVTFQEFIPKLYSKKTSLLLIDLCEQFLQPDDTMIKEEACKMAAILVECLDSDDIDWFLNLVYKMYDNDWNRCIGIDLMALSFYKLPELTQLEFRQKFSGLMNEDSTLAKAAMARNYAKIVQHYPKEWVETEAIETLQELVEDIQVTVRVHAVETAITISTLIEEDLIDKHLTTIFEKLSQDNAWKVRLEVAARIVDIQKAVKPKLARMLLITLLQKLCQDRETIVRKCLALNIIDVVIHFKETSDIDLKELFEVINELNKDINDEVKNNLMNVMMDCATHLNKDECRLYLLPLMKNTLMCQTITGVQKVQEQCVYNINKLITVLGYEVMQEEIERFIFDVLSAESQWRTRRRLVMTLNILAMNASEEYFTKVCLPFYKKMLNDSCHAVRRIVPMILPVLVGRFGFEWAKKNILSYVFSFHDHPTSFQRLLVLYSIEELVKPSLMHIDTSKYKKKPWIDHNMDKDYLYKVFSLNEMMKHKLDQLEVSPGPEDGVTSSDLLFYGEDMADEFGEYEVPQEDIMGLLSFIIKHIIPIIVNYLSDKVINVINRAISTHRIIMELNKDVTNEFQQEKFKDILDSFNKESRLNIESNILHKLTEVDGHMEEKIEHPVRGKEFDTSERFADALEGSFDGDVGVVPLSSEDVLKAFEEFDQYNRLNRFDTNENVFETNEDLFCDGETNDGDVCLDEGAKIKTDDKRKQVSDNNNAVVDEVDGSTGDVEKHLLDDVDMKLFDQKKTVLEFYSDPKSDAIDI